MMGDFAKSTFGAMLLGMVACQPQPYVLLTIEDPDHLAVEATEAAVGTALGHLESVNGFVGLAEKEEGGIGGFGSWVF